jgi:hypothetical protein
VDRARAGKFPQFGVPAAKSHAHFMQERRFGAISAKGC